MGLSANTWIRSPGLPWHQGYSEVWQTRWMGHLGLRKGHCGKPGSVWHLQQVRHELYRSIKEACLSAEVVHIPTSYPEDSVSSPVSFRWKTQVWGPNGVLGWNSSGALAYLWHTGGSRCPGVLGSHWCTHSGRSQCVWVVTCSPPLDLPLCCSTTGEEQYWTNGLNCYHDRWGWRWCQLSKPSRSGLAGSQSWDRLLEDQEDLKQTVNQGYLEWWRYLATPEMKVYLDVWPHPPKKYWNTYILIKVKDPPVVNYLWLNYLNYLYFKTLSYLLLCSFYLV